MAKTRKKAAKTPARKATKNKAMKKKAMKKKASAKRKPAARAGKTSAPRIGKARRAKASARRAAPGGVQLGVSLELDARLRELATEMGKSLEEILIQALTEFADNWEDHLRTVRNLNAGDDRMQLVAPTDESAP